VTVDIRPIARPGWDPLPFEGSVGVVGRVLVQEEDFFVAQLRSLRALVTRCHKGGDDARLQQVVWLG
jgi:hypothetical protein